MVLLDQWSYVLAGSFQHKSFCPEVFAQPPSALATLCQKVVCDAGDVIVNFPVTHDWFRDHTKLCHMYHYPQEMTFLYMVPFLLTGQSRKDIKTCPISGLRGSGGFMLVQKYYSTV